MSTDQEKGFYVTAKSLTTMLSLLALMTAMYTGVSSINSFAFRLDRLELEKIALVTTIEDLTNKVDLLNNKIIDLTIILNRVEDRYARIEKSNSLSKIPNQPR